MHRPPRHDERRRLGRYDHSDLYAAYDQLQGLLNDLPDEKEPFADFVRTIAPQLDAVVSAATTLKDIILSIWPRAGQDDERMCDKCNAVAVMNDVIFAITKVRSAHHAKGWDYIRKLQHNYPHMLRSLNVP